jgi:hypothetical protein
LILEYIRGINVSQEGLFENSIMKKLLEEENKFSRINYYKFGFLTWNLAGKNCDDDMDLENTMLSDNEALNEP